MRKLRNLTGAFGLFALMAATPLSAESLADAMVAAYKNSNLLEQNRALLRAADEDVAASVAALRPVLSYVATAQIQDSSIQGQVEGIGLTLSTEMTLFDFGGRKIGINVAKEAVLATRQGLVGIEQQVLFDAVQAYMGMIRASEFVALRQSNVELIDQELEAARNRFELGEITRTDVALAEARQALSQANLAAAQGDLMVARETYKAVVGHYPTALNPVPSAPELPANEDAAVELAYARHPAIQAAKHEVTIGELSVDLVKAGIKPKLAIGGNASISTEGDTEGVARLTLGGPIYQGGLLTAQFRQAEAKRDAARSALLSKVIEVEQAVRTAYAQRKVAQAQLAAINEQIRAARVAFRGVKEEATLGARTTIDVLNAEQDLLDAEANRISATADLYIATYAVLAQSGLLTVEHLGLGVPTYDPEAYFDAVKKAPIRRVSPQGEKLDLLLKSLGKE